MHAHKGIQGNRAGDDTHSVDLLVSDAVAITLREQVRPRWHGWAPLRVKPVWILLGAMTMLLEIVAVGRGITLSIGGVAVSPAFPPALMLATLVGWRSLGFSMERLRAWREFVIAGSGLIMGLAVLFAVRLDWARGFLAVTVAATEEEFIFRLALPVAVGAVVAAGLGREACDLSRWGGVPRFAAVSTAAVVFAVMPGHLTQIAGRSPLGIVPFLSVGLLLTYVVLRTGDLLPGIILHVLLNLATFAYAYGGIDHILWAAVIVAGVGTFGWTAERAGKREGIREDGPLFRSHDAPAI